VAVEPGAGILVGTDIEEYMRVHDSELFLFTRFIYYTFIRPGELRLIRINDLRLKDKYLFVKGEISKNGTSAALFLEAYRGRQCLFVGRRDQAAAKAAPA